MNFTALGALWKWNHTIFGVLWLTYFTLLNILWFHPCCRMYQDFLLESFIYLKTTLSSFPLVDTWVTFTFWLFRITLLRTWVCRYVFGSVLSLLWGVYLEVNTNFWKSLEIQGQIAVEKQHAGWILLVLTRRAWTPGRVGACWEKPGLQEKEEKTFYQAILTDCINLVINGMRKQETWGKEGGVKEKGYLPEWQFSRQLWHCWWLPHVKFLSLWFLWLFHLLVASYLFSFSICDCLSCSSSITASVIVCANHCLSHLSPQSQDRFTILYWPSLPGCPESTSNVTGSI